MKRTSKYHNLSGHSLSDKLFSGN